MNLWSRGNRSAKKVYKFTVYNFIKSLTHTFFVKKKDYIVLDRLTVPYTIMHGTKLNWPFYRWLYKRLFFPQSDSYSQLTLPLKWSKWPCHFVTLQPRCIRRRSISIQFGKGTSLDKLIISYCKGEKIRTSSSTSRTLN